MNDKIQDGGPAFPHSSNPMRSDSTEWGMTLRDWFAGQALASGAFNESRETFEKDAEVAYRYADAMLKAREGSK